MLLKLKSNGLLVEVCQLSELTDPRRQGVTVKNLKGYRDASPLIVNKSELMFVSGEELPVCWQADMRHCATYAARA